MKLIDVVGRRFGRLLVLARANGPGRRVKWRCVCDCGGMRDVVADALLSGRQGSCGCLRRERTADRSRKHGHTLSRRATREYRSWGHAKSRCYCETNAKYPLYGGRGITMCERWRNSFQAFYEDMGPCPAGHSIDRIDNDGNYEPSNCRWAPASVQSANNRNCTYFEWRGIRQPLKHIARAEGVNYKSLHHKISRGASLEDAIAVMKRA